MKRGFSKSMQIVVIIASLIWLGSMYQVRAAPPTPIGKEPTGSPEPSPTPAIDVQAKLEPYQSPGIDTSQSNGRILEAVPSLPETNIQSSENPSSQFVDTRAKLKPYQISEMKPSQTDGRLLQKSTLLSEGQESFVGAMAQQSFNAIADAMVVQGYPTLNFGNTMDMWAGYDDSLSPDGRIVRSLIRFNLANLSPNQIITKATLRVYLVASYDFPNTNRTITTYRITSPWSENSVTWNNKPGYGSAYGSKPIVHGAWGWYEFDVTNLVRAWYNGTYTNYGIMLRGPEVSGPDSSWRGFSTREGSFTPQLVVEHTTSTPTPPPVIIPTPTPVLLYLPYVAKSLSPTAPPTPPPGSIHFVGTTNQGRSVDLDIKPDLSAVTRFRLDARVECPGVTSESAPQISNPTGWPITNRQFEIHTSAGGGEEDVFAGEFDPTFSSVQGTWLRWIIIFDQPICHNTGTWSASRQ